MTTTATSWTITVEEDPETGDLLLPLPDDFLATQGWVEGDVLDWTDNLDGSWSISKVDNPTNLTNLT